MKGLREDVRLAWRGACALIFMMLFALAVILPPGGCAHRVTRDARAYRAEVEWSRDAHIQAAKALMDLATRLDAEGKGDECLRTADLALTLAARGPWHANMALHLAGIEPEAPGPPPDVAQPETLCSAAERAP